MNNLFIVTLKRIRDKKMPCFEYLIPPLVIYVFLQFYDVVISKNTIASLVSLQGWKNQKWDACFISFIIIILLMHFGNFLGCNILNGKINVNKVYIFGKLSVCRIYLWKVAFWRKSWKSSILPQIWPRPICLKKM